MLGISPPNSQSQVESRWCDWCGEVHHKQTYCGFDGHGRTEVYGYMCWFSRNYPGWSRWVFLLALLSVTAWPLFGITEFFSHLYIGKDGGWDRMVGVHWWLQVVWLTLPLSFIAVSGGPVRDVLLAWAVWAVIATCIFVGTHSFIPAWVWVIGVPSVIVTAICVSAMPNKPRLRRLPNVQRIQQLERELFEE